MFTSFTHSLAAGTILLQIVIVLGVVAYMSPASGMKNIFSYLRRHALFLAWLLSLGATAASLFYSNIVGFTPCSLCWWQRIFMYPQVIILGMAWRKKDDFAIQYSLPILAIGALVALYHTYLQYGGTSLLPCNAGNAAASLCAQRPIWEFGYITLPLMSLTAFVAMIALLALRKKATR